MKVIIDENINKDKYILQLGDLVEGEDDEFYVVTYQFDDNRMKHRYILWSLDGDSGYNGYYDTLENLTDSLTDDERMFKATEYELRLVKKEDKICKH